MSWESYGRAAEKGPFWIGVKIVVLVIGLGAVIGVLTFLLNPFKQAGDVINKTIDADNVIANYEWFKSRAQDIRSVDAKIDSAKKAADDFADACGPRKDWKREDREEHARLSAIHLGLTQQRNDLAAEYNARTEMANRSLFKSNDLPESFPIR